MFTKTYGYDAVIRLLGTENNIATTGHFTSRLRTELATSWVDTGKTAEDTFTLLKLDKTAYKIFTAPPMHKGTTNPALDLYVAYVRQFNEHAKKTKKKIGLLDMFSKTYGDNGVAKMVEMGTNSADMMPLVALLLLSLFHIAQCMDMLQLRTLSPTTSQQFRVTTATFGAALPRVSNWLQMQPRRADDEPVGLEMDIPVLLVSFQDGNRIDDTASIIGDTAVLVWAFNTEETPWNVSMLFTWMLGVLTVVITGSQSFQQLDLDDSGANDSSKRSDYRIYEWLRAY
ncbi:hypothetical protein JG687_00009289 [Phytophthora cactorum]|uniref:Uncharacterized protein n=1 Tax=Phytophthora cactorum TaxID=29920 RepID=A0A8T1UED5_9STRA|nr:hypothetical protein JG687_00009289 [Phytophthora cactorum]